MNLAESDHRPGGLSTPDPIPRLGLIPLSPENYRGPSVLAAVNRKPCTRSLIFSMLKLSFSFRQCPSYVRQASTSSGPFPFPSQAHPTPHQIFHLPIGASQKDIKGRCRYPIQIMHHLNQEPTTAPCYLRTPHTYLASASCHVIPEARALMHSPRLRTRPNTPPGLALRKGPLSRPAALTVPSHYRCV